MYAQSIKWVASLFILLAMVLLDSQHSNAMEQKECPPTNKTCEYWWYVRTRLVMTYNYTHLKWNESQQMFYPYNKDHPADFPVSLYLLLFYR